jgi:hypothetical protein
MAPHVSLHAFRSQASVSSFNSCVPRPDGCTRLTRIGYRQEEPDCRPYSLEHDFRGTALQHPKSRIIKDQGNTTHIPTNWAVFDALLPERQHAGTQMHRFHNSKSFTETLGKLSSTQMQSRKQAQRSLVSVSKPPLLSFQHRLRFQMTMSSDSLNEPLVTGLPQLPDPLQMNSAVES